MDRSGLREVLDLIDAENTTPHLLSGKALGITWWWYICERGKDDNYTTISFLNTGSNCLSKMDSTTIFSVQYHRCFRQTHSQPFTTFAAAGGRKSSSSQFNLFWNIYDILDRGNCTAILL
jgi:hypothetical protein